MVFSLSPLRETGFVFYWYDAERGRNDEMRDGGVSISQDISIVQKFQSISIHILEINDVYTYAHFFIIILL